MRFSENSEMSAPDTNARSPAPWTTITCTSGSVVNASRMRGTAICMSYDIALSRAGLLYVIQPMPSATWASIFSVPVSTALVSLVMSLRQVVVVPTAPDVCRSSISSSE